MIDKPKRKNNEFAVTRYDDMWLYNLYRWLRLSRTREIAVPLSPQKCIEYLEPIPYEDKRNRFDWDSCIRERKIAPLESGTGYEFQLQIRSGWREYAEPNVNGLIVEDGNGGRSIVTLRVYPDLITSFVLSTTCAVSLLGCCCGFWRMPASGLFIAMGMFFIFIFFCYVTVSAQTTSLDHVVKALTQPQ